MAIWGKMANLDGENGENCHMAGDSNWIPKVASWRVAILEITVKMAILAKMAKKPEGWRNPEHGKYSNWTPSGPLKLDN